MLNSDTLPLEKLSHFLPNVLPKLRPSDFQNCGTLQPPAPNSLVGSLLGESSIWRGWYFSVHDGLDPNDAPWVNDWFVPGFVGSIARILSYVALVTAATTFYQYYCYCYCKRNCDCNCNFNYIITTILLSSSSSSSSPCYCCCCCCRCCRHNNQYPILPTIALALVVFQSLIHTVFLFPIRFMWFYMFFFNDFIVYFSSYIYNPLKPKSRFSIHSSL